ncbi:MAG: non-canonical purine NTP pyrophosphatase [Acidobacteria bacterium]|nr:non-canonical purine NTP pyrophosphatase [Acidobacteriota bacterium]
MTAGELEDARIRAFEDPRAGARALELFPGREAAAVESPIIEPKPTLQPADPPDSPGSASPRGARALRAPSSPSRLVVATTNAGKVREIVSLLRGVPFAIVTIGDWPPAPAPDEAGTTFEENARQKALHYAAITGELTVAEDSGLEIDALGGQPGVESARYGGEGTSYPQKFALIYEGLRARGGAASGARFVCALALARAGRVIYEARGTVEGLVAPEPKGAGGFGYDPIFYYPPFGQTLAEAGADRKASVSHRGEAFRKLRTFLTAGLS